MTAAILAAILTACQASATFTDRFADSYVETVEAALLRTETSKALCDGASGLARAAIVVALSAEKCLSCDEVGFVLRSFRRVAGQRNSELVVVVPDTAERVVCPFLRRERLLGLIKVRGITALPWTVSGPTDGYLKYERSREGATRRRAFVQLARQLLRDTLSTVGQ